MIEFVYAAIGAVGAGALSALVSRRGRRKAERDERAVVIAMGLEYGIEYVPGEDFNEFRKDVVRARDARARAAQDKWFDESRREQNVARARDAKGRFV